MNRKIREWYMKEYASDELGASIKPDITFGDLVQSMFENGDASIYDAIGVGDSVVRERIFDEIADTLGVSYDAVYQVWLRGVELVELFKAF